jgi:Arc/MetJ-type ribon-helix-helix transcriptional regulator
MVENTDGNSSRDPLYNMNIPVSHFNNNDIPNKKKKHKIKVYEESPEKREIVTINIPNRQINKIESLIEDGHFESRSDFFRNAIQNELSTQPIGRPNDMSIITVNLPISFIKRMKSLPNFCSRSEFFRFACSNYLNYFNNIEEEEKEQKRLREEESLKDQQIILERIKKMGETEWMNQKINS